MKQYENIPKELKLLPQWVCHRDKKPFNPVTGKAAKAGQLDTWTTYDKAVKASGSYDGIGFEFNNNGIVGIDLDKVIDADGTLLPGATGIVEMMDSYTEISPSGKGLHIFVKGDIPVSGRRKGFIEVYKAGRYFTMTGNVYGAVKPINECTKQLKLLWDRYFGEQEKVVVAPVAGVPATDYLVIGLARDAKFKAMWNGEYESDRCISESEKDLALMGRLLYWCSGDVDMAVEAFMNSPYAQQKDTKHIGKLERADYMKITIERALKGLTSTAHEDDERYRQEQGFTLDDMGNAKRLVALYGSGIRFSYIKNSWYCWDGKVWKKDVTGEINRLADQTVESMYTDAIKLTDPDKRDSLLKHASKTRSIIGRKAMIESAKHLEGIPVRPADFDGDPWLLNVQNGVLNLKTGEMQQHSPSLMITQICNASYNPKAKCPR